MFLWSEVAVEVQCVPLNVAENGSDDVSAVSVAHRL